MYNQTLHRDRKHFYCCCLQFFNTAQVLEKHVNGCFNLYDKKMIKMAKKM